MLGTLSGDELPPKKKETHDSTLVDRPSEETVPAQVLRRGGRALTQTPAPSGHTVAEMLTFTHRRAFAHTHPHLHTDTPMNSHSHTLTFTLIQPCTHTLTHTPASYIPCILIQPRTCGPAIKTTMTPYVNRFAGGAANAICSRLRVQRSARSNG